MKIVEMKFVRVNKWDKRLIARTIKQNIKAYEMGYEDIYYIHYIDNETYLRLEEIETNVFVQYNEGNIDLIINDIIEYIPDYIKIGYVR